MAIELRRVYEDVNDWRLDAWIVEDDEPSAAEVFEWLIERGEIRVEFSDPRMSYFTAQIDAKYLPGGDDESA